MRKYCLNLIYDRLISFTQISLRIITELRVKLDQSLNRSSIVSKQSIQ